MDYETENELKDLMNGIADDLLETKAVIDALIDINETDTTSCVVLGIAHDLVRKVFQKSGKCKSLLELV